MTLTVISGLWPHATEEVMRALLAGNPGLRPVRYCSPSPGVLTRDGTKIPVTRDSVAAALLDDLRTVAGNARRDVLVSLPESYEPDQFRTAWFARMDGAAPAVTTAVPAELVLDGLTDESAVRSVGLHQSATDERSVGDLVARQLEQADTVALCGELGSDDEWEEEQLRVLLRRVAPWAQHCEPGQVALAAAGRHRREATLTRGLRGRPVGVHEPLPDHGVVASVFHARRPFHPGRLHDALDEVTDGVLRSRGHFWLASRPDLVLTWESSGCLSIGPVSGWLADLPAEHWHTVDPERRLAADIDWDPYYGDRHHHLAFVGIDLDPVRLHRILTACLLSDAELSDGEIAWRSMPDPFRRAYPGGGICPPATAEEKTP